MAESMLLLSKSPSHSVEVGTYLEEQSKNAEWKVIQHSAVTAESAKGS